MKNKEKYYSVFKWLLIALIVAMSLLPITDAKEPNSKIIKNTNTYAIEEIKSKSGQKFIKVFNKTPERIYCVVSGENYWKDFTVYAKRSSRPHIKPTKNFRCTCQ